MTPSETLSRAADLIRDTAAAATDGPWFAHDTWLDNGGFTATVLWNDARWIALMSPAVAGPVEAWLRDAAEAAKDFEYWLTIPPWVRAAADLARAVLGEKEETTDGE